MTKPPARRELKQERAERTRVEILESAIRLFARQGFLSTTMADLARAIKMSSGALYWHFPAKEDILLAAVEELHQRFLPYFVDLLTEGRKWPAREQLMGFLKRTQDVLRQNREYATFFIVITAELVNRNERVEKALREALSVYTHLLASIVRYGQKQGEFRQDVDAKTLGHGMVSAFAGMIIHQQLYQQELGYDPLVTTMNLLIADGVRHPAAPPQSKPDAPGDNGKADVEKTKAETPSSPTLFSR